ncbi:ABC transporter permease [Streptomyces parvulus]|uniref:ABC transporter permease n=1 Tax=Streptomyces parvulus TaxID=146923 RepID=UPI00341E322B
MDLARTEVGKAGRRARNLRGSVARLALMAGPVAFFAVFFAYPVAAIVARGLEVDGVWRFGRIGDVLAQSDVRHVLWFTTWQALASTALTLLVALPGAYVFARFDFPGKQVLRAVVTVPFVLPTVVVGTAFLALVGRGGLLDELWGVRLDTTVWAILLAHVFFNYAVVVRTVGGLWAQLDPRQEEAARMLGASRARAWRQVTLPALAPAVAAAALMVFLFTFTSFGVVQILGGPAFSTLEVEIYRQTSQVFDLSTAAVLTLIQFAAVVAVLAVHAWTVRRRESALRLVDAATTARRPRGAGQWALLAGVLATVALLVVLPLAVLVQRSLGAPGFGYYRALTEADGGAFLVPPIEAIGNSLQYAGQEAEGELGRRDIAVHLEGVAPHGVQERPQEVRAFGPDRGRRTAAPRRRGTTGETETVREAEQGGDEHRFPGDPQNRRGVRVRQDPDLQQPPASQEGPVGRLPRARGVLENVDVVRGAGAQQFLVEVDRVVRRQFCLRDAYVNGRAACHCPILSFPCRQTANQRKPLVGQTNSAARVRSTSE